jgi:hypothetical protein
MMAGLFAIVRVPGRRSLLLAASVLLLGFLSLEIYRAFYPGAEFYRKEFAAVAKADFPPSGRIIFSTATFPDIHGDYVSCAVFRVDAEDFAGLLTHIQTQPIQNPGLPWISECRRYPMAAAGPRPPLRALAQNASPGEHSSWGLLDDGQTVLFELASW